MYRDVIKKLNHYKEKIIKEFINKGIYPNNQLIENNLKNIDAYLSILKYEKVSKELFDVDKHNFIMNSIEQDLTYLYELLYELTVVEYNGLKSYVDSHLDELEEKARYYKMRIDEEVNSTSIGKTILFNCNDLYVEKDGANAIIEVGKIESFIGSKIGCFIDSNANIDPYNIIFQLSNPVYNLRVSPYNLNNDTLIIPGDLEKNEHDISINEDQILKFPLLLKTIDDVNNNTYIALAGKNKISIKNVGDDGTVLENLPIENNAFYSTGRCYIEFYVYNGENVSFRFNKKPVNCNFSIDKEYISNLKPIHHFFIECDKDFTFEISLDKGEVYAAKEQCIVNEKNIYYANSIDVRDYKLIEYKNTEKMSFDVTAIIYNMDKEIEINSIYVKELTTGGGF